MTDHDAALRVVLGTTELDQLTMLRKENAELQKELNLWRGPTKLPTQGAHYATHNNLIEDHGWDFGEHNVAMRYEGIKECRTYNEGIKEYRTYIDHIFTLPYKYEEWGDQFSHKTGFIKIGLQTYDLHQIVALEPEDMTLYDYVDEDNVQCHFSSS